MKSSYLGQIEYDFIKGWCAIHYSFHEFLKNLLYSENRLTSYLAKKIKFQNIASSLTFMSLPVLLLFAIYRWSKVNIVFHFFSSLLAKYEIMPFHIIFRTKLKRNLLPYNLYLRKYRTSSIINIKICLNFFKQNPIMKLVCQSNDEKQKLPS